MRSSRRLVSVRTVVANGASVVVSAIGVMGAVGLVAASAALGCGPSLRTLVESDMRFEHCYRIDDDPGAPLEDKRACWRDWTARYTKGQDRSRVAYAKDRLKVLDAAPGTSQPSVIAAPAATAVACPPPSSPYSPPPPVAPSGEVNAANVTTSWRACGDTCTKSWRGCVSPCGAAAGCVVECDVQFKDCMKGCF